MYHISIEQELQRIYRKRKIFNQNINYDESNILNHIYNGEIHKKILQSNYGKFLRSGKAFTFLINTDGISHNNITMWPIFLSINEIKLDKMFSVDNIIIITLSKHNLKFTNFCKLQITFTQSKY